MGKIIAPLERMEAYPAIFFKQKNRFWKPENQQNVETMSKRIHV